MRLLFGFRFVLVYCILILLIVGLWLALFWVGWGVVCLCCDLCFGFGCLVLFVPVGFCIWFVTLVYFGSLLTVGFGLLNCL